MTVTSIVPVKNKRMKVCLEDGTDFLLYRRDIRQYDIEEGADLSDDMMQKMLHETLCPRAAKRAMFLLEQQDRSESNLREKLNIYPQEAVDYAIDYVKKYHYLDDRRMAENYVRYHDSNRSRRRLRMDLMKKGIPSDVADAAIEAVYSASEEEQIAKLLVSRHYDPETADDKERARMYRFLAYRGFNSTDIMRALRGEMD